MAHKRSIFPAICAAALTLSAISTQAQPGVPWRVNPLPGTGNFEVIDGARPDNRRVWCEAGTYALRHLRAKGTTRIFLTNPNGAAQTQARARGTGFTINPDKDLLNKSIRGGQDGNYAVSIRKVGYNFSVSSARNFCDFDILAW